MKADYIFSLVISIIFYPPEKKNSKKYFFIIWILTKRDLDEHDWKNEILRNKILAKLDLAWAI